MEFDHSYAQKLSQLVSPVKVTELTNPTLSLFNHQLANEIGLDQRYQQQSQLFKALFEPNGELNQHAVAQKYGGHQFGGWNPDLGDGRGLLLAELVTPDGGRVDLHLKGAGQTPYSRFGDGRAVLRSTIREYLASEALHHLGVPTSRALCLISSDEVVYRETQESGAMMIRTSQSHIRFGHFEYFYHSKQLDKLQQLFDYTLDTHFGSFAQSANPYLSLLESIITNTADLIAKWQAVGFCHGVMNTDNMSIHGITFDYGPYAFLDAYVPDYICNHSDHSGRYAFDQQPGVALWNLNALAHAFTPYLTVEQIKAALQTYEPRLQQQFSQLMTAKLGITQVKADDMSLLNEWLNLLKQDKRDYTLSFRLLCDDSLNSKQFVDHFIDREKAQQWFARYQQRLSAQGEDSALRTQRMRQLNPCYILRNYLAQTAIDKAQSGDFTECRNLLRALSNPYHSSTEFDHYQQTPPDWGQDMEISCSS